MNGRAEYATATIPGNFPPASDFQVFAATFTADYSLWANVLSRLEFRWDHDLSQRSDGALFDGGSSGTFGTTSGGGFTRKNLFTIALNLVYKF